VFIYPNKRYYLEQAKDIRSDLEIEKRNLQVAIIDDNEVPYIETLRNNGFNITHHVDIDNFEMIKLYPIIICDIRGVGKKFGSDKEGAHIIREARRLYPDKYLIAMSSDVYNIRWVKLLDDADDKIMRDADVDQVIDALNTAINIMRCNKERWLRVRNNLLHKHKLDLFDVWKIEQAFIKSVISKDKSSFKDSKVVSYMDEIVKGLLINFISGLVL
jgi:hypothetical protein